MNRQIAGKLVAAAAASLALSGTAAFAGTPGGTVEVESEIKLAEKAPAFHGKVKADNENCVEERTVKLFKERRNGGKKLLGKTTTSNKGRWKVLVDPLKSGAYFAVVKKAEQGTAGTIYLCLRDKSKTAVVD